MVTGNWNQESGIWKPEQQSIDAWLKKEKKREKKERKNVKRVWMGMKMKIR